MYKNESNKSNYVRRPALRFTLPISAGIDGRGQSYEEESLYDILKQIPYQIISIPVQMSKELVFGNNKSLGKINVGYINRFDEENKEITFTLFNGKNTDNICQALDVIGRHIYAAVSLNREPNESGDKTVRTVISFEIV